MNCLIDDGKDMKMRLKKSKSQMMFDLTYYFLRIVTIIAVFIIFIPACNPARISENINRNMSLFTTGISYSTLIDGFGRAFKKGWAMKSTFRMVNISAIIALLGTCGYIAGGCASLGNNKLKRLGLVFSSLGCILNSVSMVGIYVAYTKLSQSKKPEKVLPVFPINIWIVIAIAGALLVASLVLFCFLMKREKEEHYEMETKFRLFLMYVPFIALVTVFSYLPLWGWRYAFFDYKAGDVLSMSKFVGFKWFKELVRNPATVRDVVNVLKNTLGMSALGILTSWLPMAFAIFLTDMKNVKFRRFVQTFTTIPNFISWVLVYAIAFCIFSTDGFVSNLMINSGKWQQGINFLMDGSHTWIKMWAWGIWKGIGWNAIIYIAAISGIDQQLYEAATVDGAGRFQKMWHITVPGLIPTFCVLLLMAVANILSNGMDQYLVFKNSTNASMIRVLDLYVYELGIGQGSIPLTTVVSMLKSVISVSLLFAANNISKLIRGESIV